MSGETLVSDVCVVGGWQVAGKQMRGPVTQDIIEDLRKEVELLLRLEHLHCHYLIGCKQHQDGEGGQLLLTEVRAAEVVGACSLGLFGYGLDDDDDDDADADADAAAAAAAAAAADTDGSSSSSSSPRCAPPPLGVRRRKIRSPPQPRLHASRHQVHEHCRQSFAAGSGDVLMPAFPAGVRCFSCGSFESFSADHDGASCAAEAALFLRMATRGRL
eukprot:1151888-Rhodomonas_salina.2